MGCWLSSVHDIGMGLGVFIAMTAVDDSYPLDAIDAVVLSVKFRAIALLSLGYVDSSIKLEDDDFDVYINDGAAA